MTWRSFPHSLKCGRVGEQVRDCKWADKAPRSWNARIQQQWSQGEHVESTWRSASLNQQKISPNSRLPSCLGWLLILVNLLRPGRPTWNRHQTRLQPLQKRSKIVIKLSPCAPLFWYGFMRTARRRKKGIREQSHSLATKLYSWILFPSIHSLIQWSQGSK